MSKSLHVIKIIHEAAGQADEDRRRVHEQWKEILEWNEKLPSSLVGHKVYCEGDVFLCGSSEQEIRSFIEEHNAELSLERVIAELVYRGITLVPTEDEFLWQLQGYLFDLKRMVNELPASEQKDQLSIALEVGRERVMEARDRFIAGQIAKTLGNGETGYLYIGASHQPEIHLPDSIEANVWSLA